MKISPNRGREVEEEYIHTKKKGQANVGASWCVTFTCFSVLFNFGASCVRRHVIGRRERCFVLFVVKLYFRFL
uniref:Transmembrane protein n=1 Tax=Anopheles dirus TaxID=7168 RepID=A0A182NYF3_9DIPT